MRVQRRRPPRQRSVPGAPEHSRMESRGLLVPLREVNRFRKALLKRQWMRELRPPAPTDVFTHIYGLPDAPDSNSCADSGLAAVEQGSVALAVDQNWRYLILSLAGERAVLDGKAVAADLTDFLDECSLTGPSLDKVQLVCCSSADTDANITALPAGTLPETAATGSPATAAAVPTATAAQFTFVDLFAGVGGFASGLGSGEFCELSGECLLACEKDHEAQTVYIRNHGMPTHGMHGDIRTLARLPPGVDLLCAGFPCQSFSRANSAGKGLDCPKNGFLFFEITRLLKQSPDRAPKALLLENVRNLLDMDNGETFCEVKTALEQCGYSVCHKVIFSDELVGVPQRRERLYIVAFHGRGGLGADSAARFEWPAVHAQETAVSSDSRGGNTSKRPCRRGLTVRQVLETDPALLEKHRLSVHQWEKVTSHRSWHTSVLALHKRRLVNLDGCARTLGGEHTSHLQLRVMP